MRHAFVSLVSALWVGFASAPALAERVALILGNAEYQRSGELANPVNDAEDMAARLMEIGYEVYGGQAHTNLSEREMSTLVRDFANSLQEGDMALFYYAGHGAQYKGDAYLIPVDDQDIEYANDLEDFAYNAETALQRITAVQGVTAVMILDACRNLPLRERPTGNRDAAAGDTAGLARMEVPPGRSAILIYATAPNQTSQDGDGRNGVFTGAFLRALENPGRRIDDIHYEAAAMVREQTGGYQAPWIELGFAGVTPPLFSELSAPVTGPDPALMVIERTWAMIRTMDDPIMELEAIDRFLETFPDAHIIGEVEARRTELAELTALPPGGAEPGGETPATGAKPGRGVLALGIPHFGEIVLDGPPGPDGARFGLYAGGFERAETVGDGCMGFIASHPDYMLDWSDPLGRLTLSAEGHVGLSLVVRTPDGAWLCSAALNTAPPEIDLSQPLDGPYRIWVGTLDQQEVAPAAMLVIGRLEFDTIRREVDRGLPTADAGLDLPFPDLP